MGKKMGGWVKKRAVTYIIVIERLKTKLYICCFVIGAIEKEHF